MDIFTPSYDDLTTPYCANLSQDNVCSSYLLGPNLKSIRFEWEKENIQPPPRLYSSHTLVILETSPLYTYAVYARCTLALNNSSLDKVNECLLYW